MAKRAACIADHEPVGLKAEDDTGYWWLRLVILNVV